MNANNMQLQTNVVKLGSVLVSGGLALGVVTAAWSGSAMAQNQPIMNIAQEVEPSSELSTSEEETPDASSNEDMSSSASDELNLSDIRAFAVTTDIEVLSVESIDPTDFNNLLLTSHQGGAVWASDPLWVGLQFLQFLSRPMIGANQYVSVEIPQEWEPGLDFEFARIVLEDKGWLDDAVGGQQYAFWLVPGDGGELQVQRALRSNFCRRPFNEFYSIQPCP